VLIVKKLIIRILFASLAMVALLSPAQAQMATMDEGLTVAQNWITLIIQKKGDWGGHAVAYVDAIQEFKRGERVLGYFCIVKPMGYIIISLRKELAPVKVYSTNCNLDPESNEGMTDLIKGCMERILNAIELRLGPIESVQIQALENILEINYKGAWTNLERNVESFKQQLQSGEIIMNYYEGEILLASSWHQQPPYNDDCPNIGCNWAGYNNYNANALVGCVATAGSQIMRHWNWPPYGVGSPYNDWYDWPNMLNRYVWHWTPTPGFTDENGNPCTQAQIDAVAELCSEVGIAVGMSYGCGVSLAVTADMEGVFENQYRYSSACVRRNRADYSAVDWFNRIKAQLNANRPIQYDIRVTGGGHSFVGDGWQEIGDPVVRQYHMNYGWDNSYNAWYTLDALYASISINDEYMLENIYPAPSLGSSISGVYTPPSFPYRYFDRDATASNAIFRTNQHLQFLHNIKVTVSTTPGSSLRFEGSSPVGMRLFSRGDISRGVAIDNAVINVYENGSIMFY
jgi:hypothetical protein